MIEVVKLVVVFGLGYLSSSLIIERERRKHDSKSWEATNRRKTDQFRFRMKVR